MNAATAVILAAGRGMRLAPATDHTPKPLVHVAGRPILNHVMDAFAKATSVRNFVVVVGYKALEFTKIVPPQDCSITLIENQRWAETNSMASLALGIPYLSSGGYIVEGDCCFEAQLFAASNTHSSRNIWYAHPFTANDDGCCLWSDAAYRIQRLSIEQKNADNAAPNRWKSCGVLCIDAELATKLGTWLQSGLTSGRERDYYDLILRDHLLEAGLTVADIGAARWFEIDTTDDLRQAESIFGHTKGRP